jgi:acyl-CoA hydrolase
MNYQKEYLKKNISAKDAAGLVKSNMWIDYAFHAGFSKLIDEELAKQAFRLENVKVRMDWLNSDIKILQADPNQEHFIVNSYFIGNKIRKYVKKGICSPIPRAFGHGPKIYRQFLKDQIDIAFICVTPMDKNGYFNFGASCSQSKAICESAKKVVLEVNESQPWTYGGYDEVIHISEVDFIVENNKYEIDELLSPSTNKNQETIANYISEYIKDGSTIQLGIGAIPNMICKSLLERGVKDLGIHSEMFTEDMMELVKFGIANGKRKMIDRGKAVYTFAAGSKKLYKFIDHNSALAIYPVDYVNDPYIIGQNNNHISVNSAIRTDLTGQINAESIGKDQISGTGGQLDFIRGAYRSPGGKAFIAIPSSYTNKNGKLISNIVTMLFPGDVITDTRTDVFYVVTEYGVVNLQGKSIWERVKLLISIAHPNFRDELEKEALSLNYLTPATCKLKVFNNNNVND